MLKLVSLLLLLTYSTIGQTELASHKDCLLNAVYDLNDNRSLEKVRERCKVTSDASLENRITSDKIQTRQNQSILIYRPIYVLPIGYNTAETNEKPIHKKLGLNSYTLLLGYVIL